MEEEPYRRETCKMSNKAKGSRVERELLTLFTENGWRSARVAGSGTNENTFCDLVAGKAGRKAVAVEVKSCKKDRIYITREQINDFVVFSNIMGLKAVIAVRFNYEGWLFLNPKDMEDTGNNWVVSLNNARSKGKRFAQFFS